MPVKVKYFALLREMTGKEEEEMEFEGRVSEFKKFICERYEHLENLIDSLRVVCHPSEMLY